MITMDFVMESRKDWAVDGICMFIIQRFGEGFSLTFYMMEIGG